MLTQVLQLLDKIYEWNSYLKSSDIPITTCCSHNLTIQSQLSPLCFIPSKRMTYSSYIYIFHEKLEYNFQIMFLSLEIIGGCGPLF